MVHPGYYDDYDPALVFQGAWKHETEIVHGPDRETTVHADAPGAQVSLGFDGKWLYYVYAKGRTTASQR